MKPSDSRASAAAHTRLAISCLRFVARAPNLPSALIRVDDYHSALASWSISAGTLSCGRPGPEAGLDRPEQTWAMPTPRGVPKSAQQAPTCFWASNKATRSGVWGKVALLIRTGSGAIPGSVATIVLGRCELRLLDREHAGAVIFVQLVE